MYGGEECQLVARLAKLVYKLELGVIGATGSNKVNVKVCPGCVASKVAIYLICGQQVT